LEQPHVLDGDDRLVGEGLEEVNLGPGESTSPGTAHADDTNRLPLLQHRNGERRLEAPAEGDFSGRHRHVGCGLKVWDMHDQAFDDATPGHECPSWPSWTLPPQVFF